MVNDRPDEPAHLTGYTINLAVGGLMLGLWVTALAISTSITVEGVVHLSLLCIAAVRIVAQSTIRLVSRDQAPKHERLLALVLGGMLLGTATGAIVEMLNTRTSILAVSMTSVAVALGIVFIVWGCRRSR